jgi:hypothetical protein
MLAVHIPYIIVEWNSRPQRSLKDSPPSVQDVLQFAYLVSPPPMLLYTIHYNDSVCAGVTTTPFICKKCFCKRILQVGLGSYVYSKCFIRGLNRASLGLGWPKFTKNIPGQMQILMRFDLTTRKTIFHQPAAWDFG